jgi:hypothetical protein
MPHKAALLISVDDWERDGGYIIDKVCWARWVVPCQKERSQNCCLYPLYLIDSRTCCSASPHTPVKAERRLFRCNRSVYLLPYTRVTFGLKVKDVPNRPIGVLSHGPSSKVASFLSGPLLTADVLPSMPLAANLDIK